MGRTTRSTIFRPFKPGHIIEQHVHKPGIKIPSAAETRISLCSFKSNLRAKKRNELGLLVQGHLYKNYNLNTYGPF